MKRRAQIKKFFRENFFSGLLVVAPLAGSLYFLVIISHWLYRKLVIYPLVPQPVLDMIYATLPEWSKYWVTKSIHLGEFLVLCLCLVIIISLAGMITKIRLGRWALGMGERLFKKIPLIGIIYSALKQLLQAMFSGQGNFSQVVMVQFPKPGIWSIGFLSQEVDRSFSTVAGEEHLFAVFVPTVPNITTGFMMLAPEREIRRIDLSIEDAFKVIMSGGLAQPEREIHLQA